MEFGYRSKTAEDLGVSAGGVASFLLLGKILAIVASGINFIIIARLLQPGNYGLYTLAIGIYGLFTTFASLNIGAYFNKSIPSLEAKKDYDQIAKVLGNGFAISIILGFVFAAIGLLGMNIINNYIFHSPSANILIVTAALGTIIAIIWNNIYAALISFGEGRHAAVSNVVGTFVQAVVSIVLVVYGFGVEGAFGGIFVGLIAGTVYGIIFIYRYSDIVFDIKYFMSRAKDLMKFSIPLTISNIYSGVIGNLSVLFLGSLFAFGVVGSYGVATKIGNFVEIIIGSIGAVLIPMFASAHTDISISKHVGKLYDYSIYFGFLFAMPIIVFVIVFANSLVTVLFSASYATAIQTITLPVFGTIMTSTPLYMALIGVGILVSIISIFGTALATSKGDVDKVLKYSTILFVIQLVSIFALVPTYGVLGLIVSVFFINNIVATFMYYNYVKYKLGLKVGYDIGKIIMANILLGIILFVALTVIANQLLEIVVGLILTLLFYPLVLSLTGAIRHYELNLLRQILSKVPIVGFIIRPFIEYADRFAR